MRVTITGATGIVGQFVVNRMLRDGHHVVAVERMQKKSNIQFTQSELLVRMQGDLDNPQTFEPTLADSDALVHTAFAHESNRYRGGEGNDPVAFWRTNLFGTLHLLEIAQTAGVKRTVLFSSRSVFDGYAMTSARVTGIGDEAELRPTTHYGSLKAAQESLVPLYGSIGACVLRPTGIYGVTSCVQSNKWWDIARKSLAGDHHWSHQAHTEVHGEDVADAVEKLLTKPATDVIGKSFNCSDIAISEHFLKRAFNEFFTTGSVNTSDLDQTKEMPPRNPMSCHSLNRLGWRPGRWGRLDSTIVELGKVVLMS